MDQARSVFVVVGNDKVWCYQYRRAAVMRPEERKLGRKSRPFRAAATLFVCETDVRRRQAAEPAHAAD